MAGELKTDKEKYLFLLGKMTIPEVLGIVRRIEVREALTVEWTRAFLRDMDIMYNTQLAKDFELQPLQIDTESKKPETYQIKVRCVNCGYEDLTNIPKGQTVDSSECPNCGCYELKKD